MRNFKSRSERECDDDVTIAGAKEESGYAEQKLKRVRSFLTLDLFCPPRVEKLEGLINQLLVVFRKREIYDGQSFRSQTRVEN